jgi:hypothetical protein
MRHTLHTIRQLRSLADLAAGVTPELILISGIAIPIRVADTVTELVLRCIRCTSLALVWVRTKAAVTLFVAGSLVLRNATVIALPVVLITLTAILGPD